MLAIARKEVSRRDAGKKSCFQIRGSEVHIGRVEYYFRRRGTTLEGALRALPSPAPSTPRDVTCTTPSPDSEDVLARDLVEEGALLHASTTSGSFDQSGLFRLFPVHSAPAKHLALPASLRIPESLFWNLQSYLQVSQASSSTHYPLQKKWETTVDAWYNTWKTACCLFRDNKTSEAGGTVQNGMDHVGEMMGNNDLVLLMCIFRLIPSLRYYRKHFDSGALEALFMKYLKSLTPLKYSAQHPMATIVLDLANSDTREELAVAALTLITDAFSRGLGEQHADILSMRLFVVQQQLVLHRYDEVQAGASKILATCDGNGSLLNFTGRALLLLADTLHRRKSFAEAETAICNVLGTFSLEPACAPLWTIEALHLLCDALQGQNKWSEAETKMREAFDLSLKMYGPEHAKTTMSLDYLERYLTHQGKHEEAAIVSAQLAEVTSYHGPA